MNKKNYKKTSIVLSSKGILVHAFRKIASVFILPSFNLNSQSKYRYAKVKGLLKVGQLL